MLLSNQNMTTGDALRAYAQKGRLDGVQLLVQDGVDKDGSDDNDEFKRTALIHAANNGHLHVVRYLVEQGADKEKTASNGSTPLMFAAEKGH